MKNKEIGEKLEQMDMDLWHEQDGVRWMNFQNLVGKAIKEVDSSGQLSTLEAIALMSESRAKKLLKDVNDALHWEAAITVAYNLKHSETPEEIIEQIDRLPEDLLRLAFRSYLFHWQDPTKNMTTNRKAEEVLRLTKEIVAEAKAGDNKQIAGLFSTFEDNFISQAEMFVAWTKPKEGK